MAEDVVDDAGCQSEGGLVEQEHIGVTDQGAGECQLLRLTSRQRPGKLVAPRPEDAEQREELGDPRLDAIGGAPRHGAEPEVLLDRQATEDPAVLGDQREATPHDRLGGAAGDGPPANRHLASGGRAQPHDGVQQGRLASPVGTDEGDHLALLDRQRGVADRRHGPVADRQVHHVQQRPCGRVPGGHRPGIVSGTKASTNSKLSPATRAMVTVLAGTPSVPA